MKFLGSLDCSCPICADFVPVASYMDDWSLAVINLVSARGTGVFRRFVRLDMEKRDG